MDGRRKIEAARETGERIQNPYTHDRAFTVSPSPDNLRQLQDLLEHTWGKRRLVLLDPFAGGGSIPFEAMRYGLSTTANELNPVACTILRGTLDARLRLGRRSWMTSVNTGSTSVIASKVVCDRSFRP